MRAEVLSQALAEAASSELAAALARIHHCLQQLDDEQIWRRPAPEMNSIGNLMLHLAGNLQQWIVAGIGGAPDIRNRPAEFAERGPIPREVLWRRLAQTVEDAQAAIRQASPDDWLRVRRIQGFDVTGLQAVFDSIPHFRGHTQEIVHLARSMLGPAYRFAFVPATREQGAPQ